MRLSLVMETQTSSFRHARDQAVLPLFRQTDIKTARVRPGSVASLMEENAALAGQYSTTITATQPRPKSNVSMSTQISFLSPSSPTPISAVLCPMDKHLLIPSCPRPSSNFKYPTDSLVIAQSPPHSKPHSSAFNPTDCHRFTPGISTRTSAASFRTEKQLSTLSCPKSNSAVSCPRDSYSCASTYCTPNSWCSHPIDINTFAAPRPQSVAPLSRERHTISNIQSRSDSNEAYQPDRDVQAVLRPEPAISYPVCRHIVSSTPKSCHYDFYTLDSYNLTPPRPKPRFDFHPMSRLIPAVPCVDEKKSYAGAYPHPCSDVFCPAHRHAYTANIKNLGSDVSYLGDRKRFTVDRPGPYSVAHCSSRRLFGTDEVAYPKSFPASSQKN